MASEGSLPCSQALATGPNPESDDTSPQLLIPFPYEPF